MLKRLKMLEFIPESIDSNKVMAKKKSTHISRLLNMIAKSKLLNQD